MAESEDLDKSSDLSETESECYSYFFIVKVFLLNMLMRTTY
jgi:hypothetical protein